MPKTVWIIGAGASKSHSGGLFPTADGLLSHLLSRYLANELPGPEAGLLALRDYFRNRLGQDIKDHQALPDLETVLCFMDSDLEVSQDPALLLARAFLVRLVRSALLALHRGQDIGSGEYHSLAGSLSAADSVITFNWDVLLDNALGREHLVRPDGTPTYGKATKQYEAFFRRFSGVGAGTFENSSPMGPLSLAAPFDGLFLKLHGSIDWLACANPTCDNQQLVFPLLQDDAQCGLCLERLQSVLVPPVVAKRVREWAVLRRLWNRAVAEVSAASEIVLWGYSLPAIDFQSRWLLSHAQTGSLERLTIINPVISGKDSLGSARHAAFVDSVRRAFGAALVRSSISLFDSFQDSRQKVAAEYPSWHELIISQLRAI